MAGNFHPTSPSSLPKRALSLLALWGFGTAIGCHPLPLLAQTAQPPTSASPTPSSLSRPLLKVGSQGESVTELQALLKLLGYYGGTVNGTFDEATAAAVTQFQKSASLSADGVVGAETWHRLLPPAPSVPTATQPNPAPAKATTSESFPLPESAKPNTPPATTKPTTSTPASKPAPKPAAANSPQPSMAEVATLPILRLGMKGPAVEGLQERLRSLGFLKGSVDGVFGAETQAAVKAAQRKLSLEPDGVVGNATWIGLLRS